VDSIQSKPRNSKKMIKRKAIVVALYMLLTSALSYAQSLSRIVENSEAVLYVRTDSLKRLGDSAEFWQITDFKQAKVNKKGEPYLSMEHHAVINCAANTQNIKYTKIYSSNMLSGRIIASGSLNQKNPIPHGTSLEVIRNFVCK